MIERTLKDYIAERKDLAGHIKCDRCDATKKMEFEGCLPPDWALWMAEVVCNECRVNKQEIGSGNIV